MSLNKEPDDLDSRFFKPADAFFSGFSQLGLTYDDVTLATCYSEVLPRDTQLDTRLAEGLTLNIPMISSDMDTVTEARMAIAMSAVSLYYYLQVLKQIYVVEMTATQSKPPQLVLSQVIIAVLALTVLVLGCAPNLLVAPIASAIKLAGL